ncbi:MAG: recombinase family protein [Gaiellales bacterium]|nr:MAG: recombinase family protein [Gaiellales bacterium]
MANHALIYVRRSVNRAGEATVSPEKQLEACIEVCKAHGWTYDTYQDVEGWRSGRFEDTRPAWLQLKQRLTKGGVAAVVVYRLDRASRSPKDFFNFMAQLQELKVDFVSATQDVDTSSPYGRMFVGLLSLWAALEAEITSERVKETVRWKQSHGIHVGDVPLGYDREKQAVQFGQESALTSVLVLNEEGAQIVRQTFELYATGNYSYRSLAEELNSRGYRTRNKQKQPNPFTHKNVQVIIGNHWLYRGYLVIHKGQENEEIVKGVHPAIVDDELADMARGVAERWYAHIPKRTPTERRFILSNLLYCAACGGEMRGTTDKPGRPIYKHRHAKGSCPAMQVSADDLEAEMLKLFDGLQFSDAELKALEAKWLAAVDVQPEQGDKEQQEKYLAQRERRARQLYMAGDLSEREYNAERRQSARQRELLGVEYGPSRSTMVHQMAQAIKEIGKAIQQTGAANQEAALMAMFNRVETNGETITRLVPRAWFGEFFQDASKLVGRALENQEHGPLYPQGTTPRQLAAIVYLMGDHPFPITRTRHNVLQRDRNAVIRELRESMTLSEIADRYQLSVQRVWEICKGA